MQKFKSAKIKSQKFYALEIQLHHQLKSKIKWYSK